MSTTNKEGRKRRQANEVAVEINLVRAFLFAGAKSVVASLWTADDPSTRTLMERFYRHIAAGEDKGSALRHAQMDLISEFGDLALPFYWAGFIMVGDGSGRIRVSPNSVRGRHSAATPR
jgi:CHAT domain-containing protein